jgi:hypothetical protein
MNKLIDKNLHDRLSELAEDCKAIYDTLEPKFKEWRQLKAEDYRFEALSRTQSLSLDLRTAILDLVGCTE